MKEKLLKPNHKKRKALVVGLTVGLVGVLSVTALSLGLYFSRGCFINGRFLKPGEVRVLSFHRMISGRVLQGEGKTLRRLSTYYDFDYYVDWHIDQEGLAEWSTNGDYRSISSDLMSRIDIYVICFFCCWTEANVDGTVGDGQGPLLDDAALSDTGTLNIFMSIPTRGYDEGFKYGYFFLCLLKRDSQTITDYSLTVTQRDTLEKESSHYTEIY